MENINNIWREQREPLGVLTDSIIKKYNKYADWNAISENYGFKAPLSILREFQDKFIWSKLLEFRDFPETFLREMHTNFDRDCWVIISKYQTLSESFIHDFLSKLDWDSIIRHQNISGKFMVECKVNQNVC